MQSGAIQLMKDRFDALSQRSPDDNVEFWFARDLMEPLGLRPLGKLSDRYSAGN